MIELAASKGDWVPYKTARQMLGNPDNMVGVRVLHKDYGEGTVVIGSRGVRFDKYYTHMHNLSGRCEKGHGFNCSPENLKGWME